MNSLNEYQGRWISKNPIVDLIINSDGVVHFLYLEGNANIYSYTNWFVGNVLILENLELEGQFGFKDDENGNLYLLKLKGDTTIPEVTYKLKRQE